MDSQEYLKKQLDGLVGKFPSIRIRYEADISNSCHFIETTPIEVYKNDIAYQQAEDEITLDFITKYPTENIVFVSEGNETVLTNVEYEIFGSQFHINRVTVFTNDVIQDCILNYANKLPTRGVFAKFEPEFLNLNATLLISTLPVIHPFLTGIDYVSLPHSYLLNYISTGAHPVGSSLNIVEVIESDEHTPLAA